jgi:ABC-type nitrate/sulfonate/bicarbonate transport system ATPase subunit
MTSYTLGSTLLEIKDVCLEYNGIPVLRNVNANIQDIIRTEGITGQIVGFLGPSGIGKTQLFRIIAGLSKPTSGSVHIYGSEQVVTAGEVGVVAQKYPLFAHRTVLSNLLLSAGRKEKNAKAAREKVLGYLNEFDLYERRHLYPAQLSGGQKQRCAIIQQVLCSEHFLLLDEPFSGLDLFMLEKTCELLTRIANLHEFNTIIVVTHDITAAASISDHLWMMGRERDEQGAIIPGARIMKEYNLAQEDLCWKPNIITDPRFVNFVAQIKEDFRYM